MITGLLIGLLLGVIVVGWYGFERQRETYGQIVEILTRDRDAAKHEASVFRRIVLPAFDKVGSAVSGVAVSAVLGGGSVVGAAAPAGATPKAAQPANPLLNRRTPFRIRFKQAAKMLNTGQRKTDALASALANQKVPQPSEEKQNVSA